MWKYTVAVDGMMCSMCEAHTNEAIRRDFSVKKVKSSHAKNETVIVCEDELDEEALRKTITDLGYDMGAVKKEPYKRFGFFG